MTPSTEEEGSARSQGEKLLNRRDFDPNTTIFSEGEHGTVAYILLSGDVTIVGGLGTAEERQLTRIETGHIFGELALMAGERRTASAVTKGGCDLLIVRQERFQQKLDEADPFLRYWIDYLSRRVIELSAR
jgi:CRP/FNR family cyclic AMP-dependent transcriptional regulator